MDLVRDFISIILMESQISFGTTRGLLIRSYWRWSENDESRDSSNSWNEYGQCFLEGRRPTYIFLLEKCVCMQMRRETIDYTESNARFIENIVTPWDTYYGWRISMLKPKYCLRSRVATASGCWSWWPHWQARPKETGVSLHLATSWNASTKTVHQSPCWYFDSRLDCKRHRSLILWYPMQ